ncbi:MAG: TIGR00282 family metallophosphoesterase [bacterium]|nr:TIGR00282 family metallophosphoesterase [bacterium]
MRILLIGDIVGRPGRNVVRELLPRLIREHRLDLVVANGENAAGGIGITRQVGDELLACGIDVLTMGNHAWGKKDSYAYLDETPRVVRPANYPQGAPGRGSVVVKAANGKSAGILNLGGRVFFPTDLECPFRGGEREALRLRQQTPVVIVDFHAEATSEKVALGYHLDGLVSVLAGTHTHVQTADERILPGGTAYITDLGMTGPVNGVIGICRELALERFLTQLPVRFEVETGPGALCGLVAEIDDDSGQAHEVFRIQEHC